MATYFVGNVLDSFTPGPSGVTDIDVDYASNIDISGIGGPNGFYATATLRDPVTGAYISVPRLWSHGKIRLEGVETGARAVSWRNSAGTTVMTLEGAHQGLKLRYLGPSGLIDASAGEPMITGTYDVFVFIHPTAGRVGFYFNGTLVVDLKDIDTSAMGEIASVRYGCVLGGNYQTSHSGVILASYNTIGHRVRRVIAAADGSLTEWAGSFADIDDVNLSDTDAVSSNVVGERSTFTGAPLAPTPAGSVIKSVAVAARIRNDGGASPQGASLFLRMGGIDFKFPAPQQVTSGFTGGVACFDVNPATTNPWTTVADINAAEFGLVSEA